MDTLLSTGVVVLLLPIQKRGGREGGGRPTVFSFVLGRRRSKCQSSLPLFQKNLVIRASVEITNGTFVFFCGKYISPSSTLVFKLFMLYSFGDFLACCLAMPDQS